MTTDPVPAITEADATGETAEIYADIKASLGVGVVNLVWRHLATIEGGLPWVWGALRPLYTSGAAAAEGERLFARLTLPDMPKFPPEALQLAGVSAADRDTVIAILDSYNRGNSLNLVALSAFDATPSGTPLGEGVRDAGASGAITRPIPSLPGMDAMDAETRAMVGALSELGAVAGDRIIPSLWRHLAYWPGFMALSWAMIAPLHHDGRLQALMLETRRVAQESAGALAHGITPGPPPPSAPEIHAALEEFRASAISRMVPVAMILRRMMPE